MGKQYVKEDPRLKRAFKEFIIMAIVYYIIYSIVYWSYTFTYGGNPHAIVMGLPWWFNLLWISLIFLVIVCIIAWTMKEEPLDPWIKIEEGEKK